MNMYIKGLKMLDLVRYVKFHQSPDVHVVINESLHTADIYCQNTSSLGAIKDHEITYSNPEYIKLNSKSKALITPDFKITSLIDEPLEINLVIIKIDSENVQVDGDFSEIENKCYSYYDRLTIIMRSDANTVGDLRDLLANIPYIIFESISADDTQVGNIPKAVIRNSDVESDYYRMDPVDFNGYVSVFDWSHAFDGFMEKVKEELIPYDFAEPVTKLPQEIPDKKNILRYDITDIQPDARGHLVGSHWKYFSMDKLPFELEFVVTETATYIRMLNLMKQFLLITDIGDYWVTANNGQRWKVATEFNFPIENNFDLMEPKGSSDTAGNVIRLNGFLHFYTISKDKFMDEVGKVITNIEGESEVDPENDGIGYMILESTFIVR